MRRFLFVAAVAVCALLGTSVAAVAGSDASGNAHHMMWVERSDVVHTFVFQDDGRPGQDPAVVHGRSPVRFGFEFGGDSLEYLSETIVDNPLHDIQMSVDGGPWASVKSGYQEPFVATPGEGPRWSWDHDGDGLGDGNGNGIGDWDGPILFWRYGLKHLVKGTHTIEFRITDDGGSTFWVHDTITVDVG